MLNAQKHVVKELLANPKTRIPLGAHMGDCHIACALMNLGIVSHDSKTNTIRLKSAEKARRFLDS